MSEERNAASRVAGAVGQLGPRDLLLYEMGAPSLLWRLRLLRLLPVPLDLGHDLLAERHDDVFHLLKRAFGQDALHLLESVEGHLDQDRAGH